MSANTPHARLLHYAARDLLEPMGLAQKGRLRLWLDDHDWWLVLVEFQPDERSRGSYLNVGVMWLWCERDDFSFDLGYRLEKFVPFRNKAQFEREAERLTTRAAAQVETYRKLFPSADRVAEFLLRHIEGNSPWRLFHAAVACGLAGRAADACRLLDQLLDHAGSSDGSEDLRRRAAELRPLADATDGFRLAVEQRVAAARAALRLLPVHEMSFEA